MSYSISVLLFHHFAISLFRYFAISLFRYLKGQIILRSVNCRCLAACCFRLVLAAAGAVVTCPTAQHLHGIGQDFIDKLFYTFFVLIFPPSDASLDVNRISLFQEALGNIGQSAPQNDVVPLGVAHLLAVFPFVSFCCCQRERGLFTPFSKF